jgi:hypothetical protein
LASLSPFGNCNIATLVCRAANAACRLVQARQPSTGIIVIDIPAVLDCADAINDLPGLIEFKR